MKKVRVFSVLSLLFNLAIVGGVAYVIVFLLLDKIVGSLIYYTVLSNGLVALTALIAVIFNIRSLVTGKKLPKAVMALKLIGVIAVTVTLLTVLFFLAPTHGWNIVEQFGNFSLQSPEFFLHLVVPALAIISFLFLDPGKQAKWPINFLSMLPLAIYGGLYIANYFVKIIASEMPGVDPYDWYGFVGFAGEWYYSLLIFAGMVVAAFLLSLAFWAINRAIWGREERELVEDEVKEIEIVPEVKEEPKPEEEKSAPEEAPKEEKVKKAPSKKSEGGKKPTGKKEVAPKEEAPAPVEEKPEEKPASEKKAPSKKPAGAKKPAGGKKPAPGKKESGKKGEAKPEPAPKEGPTKVYHLTKRKEDGKWAITFVGGQKAVKLFKTKKEAEAALKVLTENQGATALIRNSKGAKAGKFASSIKTNKPEKPEE